MGVPVSSSDYTRQKLDLRPKKSHEKLVSAIGPMPSDQRDSSDDSWSIRQWQSSDYESHEIEQLFGNVTSTDRVKSAMSGGRKRNEDLHRAYAL